MYALDDAGILEIMYGFPGFLPVLIGENKLGLTGAFDFHFHVFIYIAVGMAGDGDGLFPVPDTGFNSLYNDGRPEYGAVQNGTDGSVGAFPHWE